MLNKKFSAIAIVCLVIFSSVVLTGCPANSSDKAATADTAVTMQDSSGMQAAPMDTSMKMDTSTMDTASPRPVRNPH